MAAKQKMEPNKEKNRKLVAYAISSLAIVVVALVGTPLHLPQAALESTQWALTASLGLFCGANVGEHFANSKKQLKAKEPQSGSQEES